MNTKDPYNCPLCQAELGINYTSWGISPEFFEYYRDIHWRYHLLELCPYCKQKLDKPEPKLNKPETETK